MSPNDPPNDPKQNGKGSSPAAGHPPVKGEARELLARAYSLANTQDMQELYRDWAETYDEVMVGDLAYLSPTRLAAKLATHLSQRDGLVLDIGCGTGLTGAALASVGFTHMDGLDFSTDMLAVARKRGIYDRLIQADLTATLPIETASYDAAICSGTFTHAHVDASCLDEIVRVIKPGGLFACTIHNDVWEPMGFGNRLAVLEASGDLRPLEMHYDIFFATSEAPDGRFCVFSRG